jgi:glycosyltransferase involved in cell wall biosynthesis
VTIFVDFSHVHRKTTGIERISLELFSREALAPLATRHVTARSVPGMVRAQWLDLPLAALRDRDAVVLCPGFPPSIALQMTCRKIVTYVHDLFLMTHVETLNRNAKLYMRPSFMRMLAGERNFLTNSMTTKRALEGAARDDARILLYRPVIRDLFGMAGGSERPRSGTALTFVAMGTVEPRKNYRYAADVITALNERGVSSRLVIVGRAGWGSDAQELASLPHVELLGHLPDDEVRRIVTGADCVICTSIDEGLGLPLVELQYAGLPTVAVDIPVFRELLGEDALFIPRAAAPEAADRIAAEAGTPGWRDRGRARSARILATYNEAARRDRERVVEFVAALERGSATGS